MRPTKRPARAPDDRNLPAGMETAMARKKAARGPGKTAGARGASRPAAAVVRRRRHKPLKVAVIGCGRVALQHVRGWVSPEVKPRARLIALCDLVPANAEACRDKWNLGDVPIVTDYRQILAMGEVQAVDVVFSCHFEHRFNLQLPVLRM